jgi:hypothetical protein
MVPVKRQEILSIRRNELIQIIDHELPTARPHSRAFACRVLGAEYDLAVTLPDEVSITPDLLAYGGYPEVAALGFALAFPNHNTRELRIQFERGLSRLLGRTLKGLTFAGDDLALLGLAEGIVVTSRHEQGKQTDDSSRLWLLKLIDRDSTRRAWTVRMRELAGDLLDQRGRLSVKATQRNVDTQALEVTLRHIWPEPFAEVLPPSIDEYNKLFTRLMATGPDPTDLEKALVRLRAIDLLLQQTSRSLFPRTDRETLAIEQLIRIKATLDQRAKRLTDRFIWVYIALTVVDWIALIAVTLVRGWAVVEPWVFYLSVPSTLAPYVYYAIMQKELSPGALYRQVRTARAQKLYRQAGFDLEAFKKLDA